MSKLKILLVGASGVIVFTTHIVIAEEIVDISFEAPLYCTNGAKSIVYAATSFNKDSFTKITDLAFFTDGYANVPVSNFYTARGYEIRRNTFTVELAMLNGSNVLEYVPQKSGDLSYCKVTVEADWRDKLKNTGDVRSYETSEFDAVCEIGHIREGLCQTSMRLNKGLLLQNPSGGPALPFAFKFKESLK